MKENIRHGDKKVLHGRVHVQYLHVYYQGIAEIVAAVTLCDSDCDRFCSARHKL